MSQLTHERDRLQDRLRALEEDITIRAREDRGLFIYLFIYLYTYIYMYIYLFVFIGM